MRKNWWIAIVLICLSVACNQSPSAAFTDGVEALQQGNWAIADSLFSAVTIENPTNADAWNNRAIARKELGNMQAALSDAKKAIELDESNALYHLTIGDIWFATGKVDEANKTAQQATSMAPENPNTWYFQGSVRIALGDWDGAIRSLRKALDIDGNLLIASQQVIAAYIMAGRYDKALYESNKLINAGMPDAINLRNRAYAFLMSGQPEAALTDLHKALLIDSTDAIAWNNKARAFLMMEKPEEAYKALSKAGTFDTTLPFIDKHRGLFYLATGDTATACIYLTKCAQTLRETWPAYMLQSDTETDSLIQLYCQEKIPALLEN